jgi:hypothetical protein
MECNFGGEEKTFTNVMRLVSVILAPDLDGVVNVAKSHLAVNVFSELITACGEVGYLFLLRHGNKGQYYVDELLEYAQNNQEEFLDKLSQLLEKKYYRDDEEEYIVWKEISLSDIPSGDWVKGPYENKVLVLKEKHENLMIDISTEEKFKAAAYYVIELRLRDGWYNGYGNMYWDGKATSYTKVAENILELQEEYYDEGANIAWWFLSKTKEDEYMGYSIYRMINPKKRKCNEN